MKSRQFIFLIGLIAALVMLYFDGGVWRVLSLISVGLGLFGGCAYWLFEHSVRHSKRETKPYKVFFHRGDELTIRNRVTRGVAWVDEQGLHVTSNSQSFLVSGRDVSSVQMFRLHGLGRVVQVDYRGGRLFVSVIRLMIGQLAFINFLDTGALREQIAGLVQDQ